jgi:hypothetical protein
MDKKRKIRLTDFRRQSWIIVKLTIPTALILLGGILVAFKYTQISEANMKDAVSVLDNSIQTESDMVSAFIQFSANSRKGNIRLATGRIQKDHDENISSIRDSIPLIEKAVSDMFFIVYILTGVMVMQFIFLIYAIGRITNKMFGPALVMEKILKGAREGVMPVKSSLRKDDEFKVLFSEIYKACEIVVPVVQRRLKRENRRIQENVTAEL